MTLDLLQYVSDFHISLTKPCELARDNLMKTRYDKKTASQKFEPGDKVLVLLPIAGKPLQARYIGPYVVNKSKSENNYILITPDRCKDKEFCHINAVSLHPRGENDVCEHYSLSDTSKLKNSDILKDLDFKLTYLLPSQRQDLKRLIYNFQHFFPGVPTRTNLIFHDATPVKQHFYQFNPIKQKALQDKIIFLRMTLLNQVRVIGVHHVSLSQSLMKPIVYVQTTGELMLQSPTPFLLPTWMTA